MAELFASGRIIDLILILVAVEACALLALRRRRGRGPSPVLLLCNLASGAALMLALRAALTGAHWTSVAGCLLGALLAHLTEMVLRFRADASETVRRSDDLTKPGTSSQASAFTNGR